MRPNDNFTIFGKDLPSKPASTLTATGFGKNITYQLFWQTAITAALKTKAYHPQTNGKANQIIQKSFMSKENLNQSIEQIQRIWIHTWTKAMNDARIKASARTDSKQTWNDGYEPLKIPLIFQNIKHKKINRPRESVNATLHKEWTTHRIRQAGMAQNRPDFRELIKNTLKKWREGKLMIFSKANQIDGSSECHLHPNYLFETFLKCSEWYPSSDHLTSRVSTMSPSYIPCKLMSKLKAWVQDFSRLLRVFVVQDHRYSKVVGKVLLKIFESFASSEWLAFFHDHLSFRYFRSRDIYVSAWIEDIQLSLKGKNSNCIFVCRRRLEFPL